MPIFPMQRRSTRRFVPIRASSWLETPTNPMLKIVDLEPHCGHYPSKENSGGLR